MFVCVLLTYLFSAVVIKLIKRETEPLQHNEPDIEPSQEILKVTSNTPHQLVVVKEIANQFQLMRKEQDLTLQLLLKNQELDGRRMETLERNIQKVDAPTPLSHYAETVFISTYMLFFVIYFLRGRHFIVFSEDFSVVDRVFNHLKSINWMDFNQMFVVAVIVYLSSSIVKLLFSSVWLVLSCGLGFLLMEMDTATIACTIYLCARNIFVMFGVGKFIGVVIRNLEVDRWKICSAAFGWLVCGACFFAACWLSTQMDITNPPYLRWRFESDILAFLEVQLSMGEYM